MRLLAAPAAMIAVAAACHGWTGAPCSPDEPELAAESAACESARRALPRQFQQIETAHFVLLSDGDDAANQAHAQWVERAHEEFQRFAQQCGLQPQPLRHKLVGVLFDQRDDYEAFAQAHDGMFNSAFSAYYSPRHDRVVFLLEGGAAGAHDDGGAGGEAGAVASESGARGALGFQQEREAGHSADDCGGAGAAARCVHETIHQLMFHTQIMSPQVQYPLWICEGLSTAFETSAPQRRFGPDCEYAPRREAFRALLDEGRLMPLRELVSLAQVDPGDGQRVRAAYQQSYALVTWLCRRRPAELRAYLASMLAEPAGRPAPARHLELFEQSFGSVEQVEREWLEHERDAGRTEPER